MKQHNESRKDLNCTFLVKGKIVIEGYRCGPPRLGKGHYQPPQHSVQYWCTVLNSSTQSHAAGLNREWTVAVVDGETVICPTQ